MEKCSLLVCLINLIPVVLSQTTCETRGRFACHDGICISIARKCDGVRDCAGGEDESAEHANCDGTFSCHDRSTNIYLENGYVTVCKKNCNNQGDCTKMNKRCLCDDECGMSCINPSSPCLSSPPLVPNSIRHYGLRRNGPSLIRIPKGVGYRLGDMIKYDCPNGQRLVGPLPRCNGRRLWSNEIPQCIDAVCHGPAPQVNNAVLKHYMRPIKGGSALVSVQEPAQYRFTAVYKCNDGLRLVGDPPMCKGDNTWSTNVQKCVVPCPDDRDPDGIAALDLDCGVACETPADCGDGLECYCDGACGTSCVNPDISCGEAPQIPFTRVNYTGEGIRRVARYQCIEGYYLHRGRLSLHCSGSGIWIGRRPICEEVFCGDPIYSIEETRGEIVRDGGRGYGAVVEFSCLSNYQLLGARSRRCEASGRWSGKLTVCSRRGVGAQCPHPGVPINGHLIGNNFSINAEVHFECDEGYIMIGAPVQTCLYYKDWSEDETPLCVDPRYPHSATDVISTLTRSLANLPDQETGLGRFISQKDVNRAHEIYFLFDISASVLDEKQDLKNELEFAKRLVKRMEGFKGIVKYSIMLFASENVTVLDITDNTASPSDATKVIEILDEVYDKAIFKDYEGKSRAGTDTSLALEKLSRTMATMKGWENELPDEKKAQRHVFIFTDGKHTDGADPVRQRKRIENQFKPNIEFYSITACHACNVEAFAELSGLSSKDGKNYIFIEDFYQLSKYLDQVTDVNFDLSKCGQAGDVGSIQEQASLGRVIGGTNAADTAWPWQVLITRKGSNVQKTFDKYHMLGGGSLLNNNWVLTAAHVFKDMAPGWEPNVVFSCGIFERPGSGDLRKSVRMFLAEGYFPYDGYDKGTFRNDIALVKIGKELDHGMNVIEGGSGGVEYSYYIRPVCLPCTGTCFKEAYLVDENNDPLVPEDATKEEKCAAEERLLKKDAKLVVTGFGHLNKTVDVPRPHEFNLPKKLQQGLMEMEIEERCQEAITKVNKDRKGKPPFVFDDTLFCLKSGNRNKVVDACQGDSGGPVVRQVKNVTTGEKCWLQIGIVSFGVGCGLGGSSFYTNVAKYVPWITQTMEDNLVVAPLGEAP